LRRGEASCLTDDQARTDTHAIPMRNYVTPAVGNYVLTSALQLGNYVIADTIRLVSVRDKSVITLARTL